MKVDKPIGDHLWGPFFIRLTLGAYFVLAGYMKLVHHAQFIEEVKRMGVLPELGATLYGILLPYVELVSGALFLVGYWTVFAALLISLMLLSFVVALGPFPEAGSLLFNKDIILLAAALSVLYTGGGRISIDKFRGH